MGHVSNASSEASVMIGARPWRHSRAALTARQAPGRAPEEPKATRPAHHRLRRGSLWAALAVVSLSLFQSGAEPASARSVVASQPGLHQGEHGAALGGAGAVVVGAGGNPASPDQQFSDHGNGHGQGLGVGRTPSRDQQGNGNGHAGNPPGHSEAAVGQGASNGQAQQGSGASHGHGNGGGDQGGQGFGQRVHAGGSGHGKGTGSVAPSQAGSRPASVTTPTAASSTPSALTTSVVRAAASPSTSRGAPASGPHVARPGWRRRPTIGKRSRQRASRGPGAAALLPHVPAAAAERSGGRLTTGAGASTLERGRAQSRGRSHGRSHAAGVGLLSAPLALPRAIEKVIGVIPTWVWLALLAAAVLAAAAATAALIATRRAQRQARAIEAVQRAAATDPLTGVLNRRGFDEAVERELARARRHGRPLALAYLDVRGLKAVNDTEGHLVGDELIRQVAGLLRDCARAGDLVGRLGGDEFGLVLAEQPADSAAIVKARLRAQLPARRAAIGTDLPWDVTIGTAAYPDDGESLPTLLSVADRRLYAQRGIELRASA